MISLKIFSGVWLVRKNYQQRKITGNEILSLNGMIQATFTGFRLLLLDSGDEGWNSATMASFVQFRQNLGWPDFDRIWLFVPDSGKLA
jgi:hypothetical protein